MEEEVGDTNALTVGVSTDKDMSIKQQRQGSWETSGAKMKFCFGISVTDARRVALQQSVLAMPCGSRLRNTESHSASQLAAKSTVKTLSSRHCYLRQQGRIEGTPNRCCPLLPAILYLVGKEGVEPSWVSPADFKSAASAFPPLAHVVQQG